MLPPHRPHLKGGRPFVDDRAALTGVVFVLEIGIPWMSLPAELGCGGGVTSRRRLRVWQAASVRDRPHRELLRRLTEADRIDWSRACVDERRVPAKGGAKNSARTRRTGASPARSNT